MSNAATRQAIAAALSTVSGVAGYASRPTAVTSGDAWPQWAGSERDVASGFIESWVVLVVLPAADEITADSFADDHQAALIAALRPVLFVDSFAPARLSTEAGDVYALSISGRSE